MYGEVKKSTTGELCCVILHFNMPLLVAQPNNMPTWSIKWRLPPSRYQYSPLIVANPALPVSTKLGRIYISSILGALTSSMLLRSSLFKAGRKHHPSAIERRPNFPSFVHSSLSPFPSLLLPPSPLSATLSSSSFVHADAPPQLLRQRTFGALPEHEVGWPDSSSSWPSLVLVLLWLACLLLWWLWRKGGESLLPDGRSSSANASKNWSRHQPKPSENEAENARQAVGRPSYTNNSSRKASAKDLQKNNP